MVPTKKAVDYAFPTRSYGKSAPANRGGDRKPNPHVQWLKDTNSDIFLGVGFAVSGRRRADRQLQIKKRKKEPAIRITISAKK